MSAALAAVPWTARDDGILLTVRLTPNARDDRIEGIKLLADGKAVLAARVRAIPEDGAANAALEKLIAKICGVAKSRVTVTSGHTQRVKILQIAGDVATILAHLPLASAKK